MQAPFLFVHQPKKSVLCGRQGVQTDLDPPIQVGEICRRSRDLPDSRETEDGCGKNPLVLSMSSTQTRGHSHQSLSSGRKKDLKKMRHGRIRRKVGQGRQVRERNQGNRNDLVRSKAHSSWRGSTAQVVSNHIEKARHAVQVDRNVSTGAA